MADLDTCPRSTIVESVSCNVTGLTSFYSPHGTAETNTPRDRQYERNAEQTQEHSQEFLQYTSDQSREMLHEGFVDSHQPYSEPIMDKACGSAKGEVVQAAATLVSVVTDVPQQGEGSNCWHRNKLVSGTSSEVLRNSSVPPEYHRRASLNETAPILGNKAYDRVSPTRLFSTFSTQHVSRDLQVRSESSGQRNSRVFQQPLLQQEEVLPSKQPPIQSAPNVSRCLHSNREWASEGHSWPNQGVATTPVARFSAETNPEELTAIHGVRLRPNSPCKSSENSATAKDLVINALCDQIQHQQWKLRVQESRLHNQEQRLHELSVGSRHPGVVPNPSRKTRDARQPCRSPVVTEQYLAQMQHRLPALLSLVVAGLLTVAVSYMGMANLLAKTPFECYFIPPHSFPLPYQSCLDKPLKGNSSASGEKESHLCWL
ncbi:hypothetical protein, conserved [Eimeria acervulina]|uniref:Uncharacterized protein n=1 Tax=Eimeria acervulina TaxID=5801 RepID=U6GHY4_EIMAC|nr:hypothetical protein, conserved [Eimeria acervulina]CDI79780.1 hypothetical protein, conserved [Eimeria acervulina]